MKQVAAVQLEGGVEFLSDAQVDAALDQTELPRDEKQAIANSNADARISALQLGMIAVAVVAAMGLFLTRWLPACPPDDVGRDARPRHDPPGS